MKKITSEQLLASAILRFKKVDALDLKLLTSVLREHNIKVAPEKSIETDILKYIKVNAGIYSLKDEVTMDTVITDNYTVKDEFENTADTDVLNVVFNMDIDLFTLRKIDFLNPKAHAISVLFNDREQESINSLKSKFIIGEKYEGSCVYDEELTLYVTKKGEVELFMHDNPRLIASITEVFNFLGYDINILPMYLERQNLNTLRLNVSSEFITDFEAFCSEQDLSPYVSETRK